MKQSIRLLLLGIITVLGLSGFTACDENDNIVSQEDEVSLDEVEIYSLEDGYAVTGTYDGGDTVRYEFCNNNLIKIVSGQENENATDWWLESEDVGFTFDDGNTYAYIVGQFSDSEGYFLINGNIHDTYDSPSDFTITNISTIECTPPI